MAKRLIKVAKELNVGTSTIVDFLNKSGFEVVDKPTAKLTDEMEAKLYEEFSESVAIKEKADQLIIGTRPVTKKEPIAVTTTVVEKVIEPEPEPPTPEPEPEPKVVETPLPEAKPQPAIQLEPEITPEPTVQPVPEVTPEPIVAETKEEPKEEPKESKEPVAEEPAAPALKVVGKIDLDAQKPTKAKKKDKSTEVVPKASQDKPANKKPSKPQAKTEKPAAKKSKSDNKPSTTKPAKETPASKKPSEPKKEEKAKKETPKPSNKVFRAEAPKLKGTKIMGKIDIKQFEKKPDASKPVASSDNNTRSKKRRRTRKKVENPGGQQGRGQGQGQGRGRGQGQGQGRGQGQGQGRGQGQGQGRGQGQGGRRPNNRPGGNRNNQGRRGRGRRDEVKEVSQKEIEDKIKSTMARLQGGGKKRQRIRRDKRETMRKKEELQEMEKMDTKLQLTEFVSVSELASLMEIEVTDVITTCMNLGVIVSINQRLDAEIIELLADEFGHEIEFISAEEQVLEEEEEEDAPEDLEPRAPIVTVMGHVDHGKTSLLDYIREANVADGEAGGITQHIGAYEVYVGEEKKKITFLDTPGHEAFTAMRARGAKVTDIAVIIIAADDSIMPQTKEAISHAQAAGVPIVFAINKIDKPGANPDRIKQELSGMNLLIEEWGGEYQSTDISAKTGQNIDSLLEEVLLRAEMLELKANPNRTSTGVILEASLDKGRGYVAKALVSNGTLNIGDPLVAGSHSGKVKAMFNERGKRIKEAGPSTPVLVLGLSGAPQAGEKFKETENEPEARQIASKRAQITREQTNRANKRISLDEIGRRLALGNFKELNLIVKGDVDGSIEALSDSLIKQSIESVQVNVIHKAVGQIIESDVLLASASDAIIIGFQVRPSLGARKLAEREGVEIKSYSIIYEAIEEIRSAIEGLLEPTKEEKILGEVEVREVYKISKVGTVAGSYVTDGKVIRNSNVRLIRNGIVIYPTKEGIHGELSSLKRFKDDVKEVKNGMECGITIKNFNDIKVGDIIEVYEIIEIKQTLQSIKKKRS